MSVTTRRYSRREVLRRAALLAGAADLSLAAGHPAGLMPARASAGPMDQLVAAHLDFGFRLYRALGTATPPSQNLFISPLSVALALSMACNGAQGATRTAIAYTLGVGALPVGDLNATSSTLLAHLRTLDAAVTLSVADALWLRQGYTALPAFGQALRRFYDADATTLDFGDPSAPDVINAWVNRQTHGLIPSIVTRIPPHMLLYLINTLYFKAPWAEPFQPAATRPGPFTRPDGSVRTLPMMTHTGAYRYTKGLAYEAISLPYAAGKVAMYIILPAAPSGLSSVPGSLDAAGWAALLPSLTMEMGTLVLPRFAVTYDVRLNAALSALGMGVAFDPQRADLSAMVRPRGERAYISAVQHRTVLRVAEQGTLAAAATSIGVGTTALPVSRFTMTVNRPFFCAIRDETTGSLLFMGAIADPR